MSLDRTDAVDVSSSTSTANSSTYELLLGRLTQVAEQLSGAASTVNQERSAAFSTIALSLGEQERLSTVNPAVPCDAVSVNGCLLVGTNPGPGLATKRTVEEMFHLVRVVAKTATDWDLMPIGPDEPTNFLTDPSFRRDVSELSTYYADFRLRSMHTHGELLLMVFGIGSAEEDIRILRWRLGDPVQYIDAYGDHDIAKPDQYDFPWELIEREKLVEGRWPHLNLYDTLYIGLGRQGMEFRIDDVVEGGRTLMTEPITETGQEVGELRVSAASLGDVLLVRVLPYREAVERFYVYNRLSRRIERADAIGLNCHRLPDNQGVVFPGGFHLANGDTKQFATDSKGFELYAIHRSPNGEDLLYAFHRNTTGDYQLLPYNLVNRSMANPVAATGYGVFDDGTVACLRNTPEAQRVHTVALYNSPFCTPERYQPAVGSDSFHGRIGNPELVRALGETLSLARDASHVDFNAAVFEALVSRSTRLLDAHSWLSAPEAYGMGDLLVQLRRSAGGVLDEFAAVAEAKRQAVSHLAHADRRASDFLASTELEIRDTAAYVSLLHDGRVVLGELTELRDQQHVDQAAVDTLIERVTVAHAGLGGRALTFLTEPTSLDALAADLEAADTEGTAASTAVAVKAASAKVDEAGERIVLLTDIMGGLEVEDTTTTTAVLSRLSALLARRNTIRASLDAHATERRASEQSAAFTAALGVLTQRASSGLMTADDPAECDATQTMLAAEIETLDVRFGDVPHFATALADKRDEFSAAFTQRRDALASERAARVDRMVASGKRVIETVIARAGALADRPAVDGFFAADPLTSRVRRSVDDLRSLGEEGRADELSVALIAARDQARRVVADRGELFDGGSVKIGRWRFGVNTEPFELRLHANSAADGNTSLSLRLTGTDLDLPLPESALPEGSTALAAQIYPSETPSIPRAVYLAMAAHDAGLSISDYAAQALDEGYEMGVHDNDARQVASVMEPMWATPGLWFAGSIRVVAAMWLAAEHKAGHGDAVQRSLSALRGLRAVGAEGRSHQAFVAQYGASITTLCKATDLPADTGLVIDALIELGDRHIITASARDLAEDFGVFARDALIDVRSAELADLVRWIVDHRSGVSIDLAAEAALFMKQPSIEVAPHAADCVTATGLVSSHPTITNGSLTFDPSRAWSDLFVYRRDQLPKIRAFAATRRALLETWRHELGLSALRPRVMSTFVRNRLIDEIYLPLIGDNLARQLGQNGAAQGLLLLISPPGYGKTSLVEYVCDLIGFALVKVSGPALGNHVTSLDPAAAPDTASAAELVKLNRGLAMGTNVVLYIDDIQHTSPEFLQKFIPLCDATRRIDGVIEGEARPFDLTGKRIAVVMAGNPYTTDGTSFKVPDMLANRADIHNLGDVVSAHGTAAFAQSYVEIGAGVNEVVAPALSRSRDDLELLLKAASGETLQSDQLHHAYTQAELGNVLATLRHMARVRDQLLKVNAAYISSAALGDVMRNEPLFQLQGSYRTMSRIAQRILPVMSEDEVDELVRDQYQADAQTLGGGAAWNLARLAEVLGSPTADELEQLAEFRRRWTEAKVGDNPMAAVVGALHSIETALAKSQPGEITGRVIRPTSRE
jgi:ATPase involved in DNA repair/ATPase family associated with various cellular activities (AAA)